MEIRNFTPRTYQENILRTCKDKNTLVVLPTGTGKTKIAILLAVARLNAVPDSKALICTPTKPLSSQICNEFKQCTTLRPGEIVLLTGATAPTKRADIWENAKIIVATPQTIQSDLINKRISLKEVSTLCIDECHRSRFRFANTQVTKVYMAQATNPRILALTASPGSTKERITDVCKNLFIDTVEIRSSQDADVKGHIQEKQMEWIEVELPPNLKQVHQLIKSFYKTKIKSVKKFGIAKPIGIINKRDLLELQNRLRQGLNRGRGSYAAYYGLSLVAQVIKVAYALELLETQGIIQVQTYFKKLQEEKTKAAKKILDDKSIAKAVEMTNDLANRGVRHPKIKKLLTLVKENLSNNPKIKIIIFANFRNTVKELVAVLKDVPGAKPVALLGQKEGITQKQQIQTIRNFEEGIYNIIIGTSISEEGLNVVGSQLAVFYDAVPSEIRRVQRMGRIGRTESGKVIFLLTKGTRDEAYYWAAHRKEKVMKKTLYGMQKKLA